MANCHNQPAVVVVVVGVIAVAASALQVVADVAELRDALGDEAISMGTG